MIKKQSSIINIVTAVTIVNVITVVIICILMNLFTWSVLSVSTGHASQQQQKQIEIPAELLARKLTRRNPDLLISPESVWKKLEKKQEIILIDVRDSQEFEKLRIPGSLNIPLFALKTKAFLKSKPLVLVNEGYTYSQLEQECKKLKGSGSSAVSILKGGLQQWMRKGGAFEGDLSFQGRLNKIPPWIFFQERNYDDWIVVDVSESRKSHVQSLLPEAVHIPFSDNNTEEFFSRLTTLINERKGNLFYSVLILNDKGEYGEVEKIAQKKDIENIFYLSGGLEEYQSFLQQQALIWQPKAENKKKVEKCRSCQ
ncbi:MAG: rhodanese-like domain-containing protein [bacterium]